MKISRSEHILGVIASYIDRNTYENISFLKDFLYIIDKKGETLFKSFINLLKGKKKNLNSLPFFFLKNESKPLERLK